MVPRSVGPWQLGEQLGRGGMGQVFRAVHEATGSAAAVKVLPATQPAMVAGIRREIGALRRIAHPGVVAILDDGLAGGIPWYAMELVEGTNLRELMTSGASLSTEVVSGSWETRAFDRDAPMPAPSEGRQLSLLRALEIARELCHALAYLHGEGIVHRDLKPDNVLVRPDGSLVLVDFGLAKYFASQGWRETLDVTTAIVGTPSYIAPEQASGGNVDARADIYAVGCMLFELLTGRPPFLGSIAEVLAAHQKSDPPIPSSLDGSISAELDVLVARLLAKEPRRRLGYASDVESRIAAISRSRFGAAPLPASGPPPRSYLYRPSLSGRSEVLEELGELLSGSGPTATRCVLVAGESGVGKTRLLSELGHRAGRAGLLVLAGDCAPGAPPLAGLRSVLQTVGDRAREEGPAAARRILGASGKRLAALEPSLGSIPGVVELPEPPPASGEEGKVRVVGDVTQLLARLALEVPTLVVLDDVQWSDELATAVLAFWLRAGTPRGLHVVAAFRAEEPGAVAGMELGPGAARIELARLEARALRAIVEDMLASDGAPRDLLAFLEAHTEGNPYFVAQYLHAAAASGLLARDQAGIWRWDAGGRGEGLARLGLPRTLRALLSRRIEELDGRARGILDACAVIGRESPVELTRAVAGAGDDETEHAVAELVRRRLVVEVTGRLRFEHDKLREVGYDLLADDRRRHLHREAAEHLSVEGSGASPVVLGRHWEAAGDRARAGECFHRAGVAAAGRFALDEAAQDYRAAVRLSPDPVRRAAARVELVRSVLGPRGQNEEALGELEQALLDAQAGTAAEVNVLSTMIHVLSELGRFPEAERVARRLVEIHRERGDEERRAGAIGDLASVLDEEGRRQEARVLFEEALDLYRRLGSDFGKATVVANLALLKWREGDLDGAVPLFEEALVQHRANGHRANEGVVLGNLAIIRFYRGDLEGAAARFREALEIHRQVGNRRGEGIVLGNLANVLGSGQDLAGARAALEGAIAIQRETGNVRSEVLSLTNLANLDLEAGDLDAAWRTLRTARERVALEPSPRNLAWVGCREACAHLAGGELQEALQASRAAREVLAGLGDLFGEALASCIHGRALAASGRDCDAEVRRVREIVQGMDAGQGSDLARELRLLEAAAAVQGD